MLIIEIYKKQWRHLYKYPNIAGKDKKEKTIEYRQWLSLSKKSKPIFIKKDTAYMLYIYFPFIFPFIYFMINFAQSKVFKHDFLSSARLVYEFALGNLNQNSISLLFSVLAFLMAFITLPTIYAIGYKDKLSELREDPTSHIGENEYFLQNFHTSRALIQLAAGICSLSISAVVATALIVWYCFFFCFVGGVGGGLSKIFQVTCFYFICIVSLHSFLSTTSATLELINERI